jgi:hypothetical protein
MAVRTVNVTYNGSIHLDLWPDQGNVTLDSGDQVQWHFHSVPPGCPVFIHFPQSQASEPHQPFGPFQYLETSDSWVFGIGNNGNHHEHPYTAMILNSEGAVATSSHLPARILNPTAHEDTSPDALVRYNPEDRERPFRVMPHRLKLEKERTAIWYIEGIPADHFVTFHFDGFQADPLRGPFLSFSWSRGFHSSWLANGAGFLFGLDPSQIPNPIQYFVRLRNALGTVVHQEDPVIEPLDPPPSGPPED